MAYTIIIFGKPHEYSGPTGSRLNLEVPDGWQLVAYLCVGYPDEEHLDPELDRHGWQERANVGGFVIER